MVKAPAELLRTQQKIRRWVHSDKLLKSLQQIIVDEAPLSAKGRVRIYAKAWQNRLSVCITKDLTVTRKILGQKKFEKIVHAYIAKFPSRSYSLFHLTKNFSTFLKQQKYPLWIQDLVKLEVAVDFAYTAKNPSLVPVEQLQQVEDSQGFDIFLKLSPSTAILSSIYPLDKIWENEKNYRKLKKRKFFIVYRTGWRVYVSRLEEAEANILSSFKKIKLSAFLSKCKNPTERVEWLGDWTRKQIIEIIQG